MSRACRYVTERSVLVGLVATKLAIHLALIGRYGYHRDELYFIECGKHLAFGYVDHPPLVPWIARLSGTLFDHSLPGLRLLPVLAGAITVWLTILIVRRLGGRTYAQAIAGLAIIVAPAYLRMAVMLNIVVFEPLFWTLGTYLVIRIVQGGDPRQWLLVGLVAGVGLLNKHTMLLWGAALVVGLALSPQRKLLRSRWAWLGGALAGAIMLPNLVWQIEHDWATYRFLSALSSDTLAHIPRPLFLLGQLLYMHPVAALIWIPGLVWLLSAAGRDYRFLGLSFLFMAVVFLWTHAKPYYLAPAYPVLLAAGSALIERRAGGVRRGLQGGLLALLAVLGFGLGAITLPLLPLPRAEAGIEAIVGRVVPAVALTHDMRDEHGWPALADLVAKAYGTLSADEQATATIFTRNYGQASALNFFGPALGLPRATSGHMSYHLWGPDNRPRGPIIVIGDPQWALVVCRRPQALGRFTHRLSMEDGVHIQVCRDASPLLERWDSLAIFRHGRPDLDAPDD